MFSDWTYMLSTAKSYLLEKSPRIHVSTTNIENILLPWLALGLITLSKHASYFSMSVSWRAVILALHVLAHFLGLHPLCHSPGSHFRPQDISHCPNSSEAGPDSSSPLSVLPGHRSFRARCTGRPTPRPSHRLSMSPGVFWMPKTEAAPVPLAARPCPDRLHPGQTSQPCRALRLADSSG